MSVKLGTVLFCIVLMGAVKPAPSPVIPASIDFGPGPSYSQGPGGPALDGITASANGFATAMATRARLSVHIRSRFPNITHASISPIVDALVEAGVTRSSIVLPPNIDAAPANFITITGIIEHPTAEMVRTGIQTLGRAFLAQPDLTLENAYAELARSNCAADIEQAREKAIRNARERAQLLASQTGVRLGQLLAFAVSG